MRRGLVKAATVVGLTLALSVVLGALAPAAQAGWAPRRDFLTWMNGARANHSARQLDRVYALRKMADQHSREMAAAGRIFHTSNLGTRLRIVSWQVCGENVGAGQRLRALFEAFMESAPHRANILYRGYRDVGIGVYRDGRIIWITLIFVG
jgi:uncharacterized protein YkwD